MCGHVPRFSAFVKGLAKNLPVLGDHDSTKGAVSSLASDFGELYGVSEIS